MRYDAILPCRGIIVRAVVLTLLRFVIVVIQMAALMAFFLDHLGWGLFGGVLSAMLVSIFMPLVATVLAMVGAVKVWLWPWWAAVLVFLPGLALSLTALAGVGAAGLLSALLFRRVQARGGFRAGPFAAGGDGFRQSSGPAAHGADHAAGGGQTIEGEVLSSRVDDNAPRG